MPLALKIYHMPLALKNVFYYCVNLRRICQQINTFKISSTGSKNILKKRSSMVNIGYTPFKMTYCSYSVFTVFTTIYITTEK